MANILLGDVLRVKIYNEVPSKSQESVNTIYYQVSAIAGPWTQLDVANAISQTHGPLFRPWQADTARYNGTGVGIVGPVAAPEAISTLGNGAGTGGSALLPTQVCGLIGTKALGYHTGSKTEKHPLGEQVLAVSRIYVSFPASFADPLHNGGMHLTQYNLLATLAGVLYQGRGLVGVGGATMTLTPKLRVRVKDVWPVVDPPLPAIVTFENVGTIYASDLWATQRRRGDRGQREAFSV